MDNMCIWVSRPSLRKRRILVWMQLIRRASLPACLFGSDSGHLTGIVQAGEDGGDRSTMDNRRMAVTPGSEMHRYLPLTYRKKRVCGKRVTVRCSD